MKKSSKFEAVSLNMLKLLGMERNLRFLILKVTLKLQAVNPCFLAPKNPTDASATDTRFF